MGNVKNNLNSLTQQINFIEHAIHIMDGTNRQVVYGDQNCAMLKDILLNLKMVQNWVMLPDHHQAALQILDGAYDLETTLKITGMQVQNPFDVLVRMLANLRTIKINMSDEDKKARLTWIAEIALLGTAKFIVPEKSKEVSNGKG